MAGVALVVDVRNQAALATIDGLLRRVQDPTTALEAGGTHMLRSIQQNFDAAGRPERWTPDAPATIKAKGSTKPLVDSGRLMGSIRKEVTRTSLTLSANEVYARIHQLGGQAGRGRAVTIPARPYLVFQDDDLDVIAEILADYLALESAR